MSLPDNLMKATNMKEFNDLIQKDTVKIEKRGKLEREKSLWEIKRFR